MRLPAGRSGRQRRGSREVHGPPAELRTRLIQAAYEAAVAEGRYEAPQAPPGAFARAALPRRPADFARALFRLCVLRVRNCPTFAPPGSTNSSITTFSAGGGCAIPPPGSTPPIISPPTPTCSPPATIRSGTTSSRAAPKAARRNGRAPPNGRFSKISTPPETRIAETAPRILPRLGADELAAPACGRARRRERLSSTAVGARGASQAPEGWRLRLQATPLRAARLFKHAGRVVGDAAGARRRERSASPPTRRSPGRCGAARRAAAGAARFVVRDVLGAARSRGCSASRRRWRRSGGCSGCDDFASLCASPRLLRNDVAFCGAPPPDSHGLRRSASTATRGTRSLAAMQRLFQRRRFTVVAPSEARAGAVARSDAPCPMSPPPSSRPARLDALADAVGAEDGEIGARRGRCAIAFVGSPTLADGWPTFERILEACGDLAAYAFHHFADAERPARRSRNLFSVETPAGEAALARPG